MRHRLPPLTGRALQGRPDSSRMPQRSIGMSSLVNAALFAVFPGSSGGLYLKEKKSLPPLGFERLDLTKRWLSSGSFRAAILTPTLLRLKKKQMQREL